MLIRVVRMTFRPDGVDPFLDLFGASRPLIRAFPGCRHLELWRDADDPHVFCTYSHWESGAALEAYRQSTLFRGTWARTKLLFADRAQAFSVQPVAEK
jgi:quinol monooxygenase YgiN